MNRSKKCEKISKFTFTGGYEFYFYDCGHEILAVGSSWSGKETVILNGKEVSSVRNLTKRIAVQRFNFEKVQYELEMNMVELMSGELHCTLIKNGVHFETQVLSAYSPAPGFLSTLIKITLISAIAGLILGFLSVKLLNKWF
jgi:hypothetical protein